MSVQAHVAGLERSYAFAALQGRLFGVMQVEKRSVTDQAKTWAANVSPLDDVTTAMIASFAAEVGWTGGGEVEFVRTAGGDDWLLDFNARFPAYIHGLSVLPARSSCSLCALAMRVYC